VLTHIAAAVSIIPFFVRPYKVACSKKNAKLIYFDISCLISISYNQRGLRGKLRDWEKPWLL
jgi:hypothetical protein